jgi:arylsulfatase A-like enzyme
VNIVFIIADQLRADHLGFSGNIGVKTPNIDSLARTGTYFENAFAANPVCMPNRSTILTGQWPTTHGVRTNGLPLNPNAETFPELLRTQGWNTCAVGKLHFQPMGWPFEEFQQEEIQKAMPEAWEKAVENFGGDFVSAEDFLGHLKGEITVPENYYGFTDVTLAVGHGDHVSGDYPAWASSRGLVSEVMSGPENAAFNYLGWEQVYASSVPAELHPTTFVAETAVEKIHQLNKQAQDFLLFVSFPDPHHPFSPPAEYFHRYDPADMVVPESFHDQHFESPDYIQRIVRKKGTPSPDPTMTWAPTEEQFRAALAAEMGSIEFIDDSVGKILNALDEAGIREETLIVLTSDHGDLFGDHGLMLKHFSHYLGAIRVPLIFQGPGIKPQAVSHMVSSADIAPTILDLIHALPLVDAQGQSLAPICRGQTREQVRPAVLVEEEQPFGLEGLPGPVVIRTLISQDFRLTEFDTHDITELYDRKSDVFELVNLSRDPQMLGKLADARKLMIQAVMAQQGTPPLPFHAA